MCHNLYESVTVISQTHTGQDSAECSFHGGRRPHSCWCELHNYRLCFRPIFSLSSSAFNKIFLYFDPRIACSTFGSFSVCLQHNQPNRKHLDTFMVERGLSSLICNAAARTHQKKYHTTPKGNEEVLFHQVTPPLLKSPLGATTGKLPAHFPDTLADYNRKMSKRKQIPANTVVWGRMADVYNPSKSDLPASSTFFPLGRTDNPESQSNRSPKNRTNSAEGSRNGISGMFPPVKTNRTRTTVMYRSRSATGLGVRKKIKDLLNMD